MFLNRLNDEQKNLFLDLCVHAAMANNDFAKEEKQTIDQYCVEMQIAEPRYTANYSLDEVVDKLIAISTKEELRIILLEITALIISDNVYDNEEQKFMDSFAERIGFSKEKVGEMLDCLNDLSRVYQKINSLVFYNT